MSINLEFAAQSLFAQRGFTVPLFDEFMKRIMPELPAPKKKARKT